MAKFCKYCGKQLEDGEVCNCEKEQSMQVGNSGVIIAEVGKAIKGMILEPVSTMKSFICGQNFHNALVLIILNAIAVAIMVSSFTREISNLFMELLTGLGSLFLGSDALSALDLELPYMKIMIMVILMIILVNLLIAGSMYFICAKIYKKKVDYKVITTWLGTNAAFLIVVHLIVAIAILVNMEIALLLYVIGNTMSLCYLYKGITFTCDLDENKVAYIVIPVAIIALYISKALILKLF
ncbi:MAG: hypothetical protein K2L08_02195 [Erysipelotrichaceae bacterium]|nr:hypothetical protein [Erysipelotrichaceae bacterium]